MLCVGVKKDGVRCKSFNINGETRCAIHKKTLEVHGPNRIRRIELKYIYEKNIEDIRNTLNITNVDLNVAYFNEKVRYERELLELNLVITAETNLNNGIDADEPYILRQNQIRAQKWHRTLQRRLHREQVWRENFMARRHVWLDLQAFNGVLAEQQPFNQENNGLQAFVNDNQNIHTAVVVDKVKIMVEKIIKINVPSEYETDTLKTTAEIILDCKLSKKAASQMMSTYCSDESIYELGEGIYASVLNSIWQYIKTSSHANDLKKILATEMEDNIGMCPQGNLSRLCNILSGYVDGIDANIKSTNQILGDRIAELIEINDEKERINMAETILTELDVPKNDWMIWITPLMDV
jgi:hypothetical protein